MKRTADLSQIVKFGSLVIPKKMIHLTPLEDPEDEEWIEWSVNQLGIVIPFVNDRVGICVMAPNGFGICFFDEINCVDSY